MHTFCIISVRIKVGLFVRSLIQQHLIAGEEGKSDKSVTVLLVLNSLEPPSPVDAACFTGIEY